MSAKRKILIWGGGGILALGVIGSIAGPSDQEATPALESAPTSTGQTTTTTAPATTASPPATTISDEEAAEMAAIAVLSSDVNERFGARYLEDRDTLIPALARLGDEVCDLAEMAPSHEVLATLLAALWFDFSAADQEMWGGSPETFGTGIGAVMAWRCPDTAAAVAGEPTP